MNWTLTRKQPPNRRVILALLPCLAGAIYFFGWRSLAMAGFACLLAFLTEWLFCRGRNEKVSEAAFVTALIYVIILPPTVPWHVLGVGLVFAIAVTKELFGGFGRNLFNPAMAGRAFVYICFPVALTAFWGPNAYDLPGVQWHGALDRWSVQNFSIKQPGGMDKLHTDGYTGATPVGYQKEALLRLTRLEARAAEQERSEESTTQPDKTQIQPDKARSEESTTQPDKTQIQLDKAGSEKSTTQPDKTQIQIDKARQELDTLGSQQMTYRKLLLGDIRGTMGVTSALLILIGGAYLFWTRTASRSIILSTVLSCLVLAEVLHLFGVRPVPDGLTSILTGGFLFGAFFMATDPISAPRTHPGRIAFGVLIGSSRVIIANFSDWNGGFMFALLLGNMFAPTFDVLAKGYEDRRKARAAAASPLITSPPGQADAGKRAGGGA